VDQASEAVELWLKNPTGAQLFPQPVWLFVGSGSEHRLYRIEQLQGI
jgi:hypothetical protein